MVAEPIDVLIIDDDEVDVMMLQRALGKHNMFNPKAIAADGMQAISWLRSAKTSDMGHHAHMILLDLNMPQMGGLEFLEKMREDPKLCDCIVFALTTSDDERDIEKAYKFNVAGYIVKSKTGKQFAGLVKLLEKYWTIIELPEKLKSYD